MTIRFFTRSLLPFAMAAAAAVAWTSPAHAQDQLDQIKASGTLVCGTIGVVPVYSFQDPVTRETQGYDIDICRAIAKQLGVQAQFKLVAGPARIPELNQGNFDIIVSTLGWSEERAKQVAYSDTYVINKMLVGVRKDAGVSALSQLKDKRISNQSGSTSGQALKKVIPEVELVNFDDVPQAFLAVHQRKVAGIALQELSLKALVSSSAGKGAEIVILSDEPVLIEYDGIGVRKDQPRLLQAVNDALHAIDASGELDQIYNRWIGSESDFKIARSFKVAPIPVETASQPPQLR